MTDSISGAGMAGLLEQIRDRSLRADSLEALEQATAELLSHNLPTYHWAGFYMLDPQDAGMLVLGPFVGAPTPHVRIPVSRGICGAAVSSGQSILVEDVHADPRYLSCSIETKSEIVVPIRAGGKVVGEIDIDSHLPAAFTGKDQAFLEEVARIIGVFLERSSGGGMVERSASLQEHKESRPM